MKATATENLDRVNALAEYMEKEFGVTPQNIDEKLEELKAEFAKRLSKYEMKEVM